MKTFNTYAKDEEISTNYSPCRKKPIVIHAKRVPEPFRVKSLEGDYAQGKGGDYLMVGVDGEHYICDADIFEKSYDWVAGDPLPL